MALYNFTFRATYSVLPPDEREEDFLVTSGSPRVAWPKAAALALAHIDTAFPELRQYGLRLLNLELIKQEPTT